jgi:hypothetical protein
MRTNDVSSVRLESIFSRLARRLGLGAAGIVRIGAIEAIGRSPRFRLLLRDAKKRA